MRLFPAVILASSGSKHTHEHIGPPTGHLSVVPGVTDITTYFHRLDL